MRRGEGGGEGAAVEHFEELAVEVARRRFCYGAIPVVQGVEDLGVDFCVEGDEVVGRRADDGNAGFILYFWAEELSLGRSRRARGKVETRLTVMVDLRPDIW